jgi:hypothetical protein
MRSVLPGWLKVKFAVNGSDSIAGISTVRSLAPERITSMRIGLTFIALATVEPCAPTSESWATGRRNRRPGPRRHSAR